MSVSECETIRVRGGVADESSRRYRHQGVAADGFTQQLANTTVIVMIDSNQHPPQTALEYIPGQMIFVGAHDHRMLCRGHVVADQTLCRVFSLAKTRQLDGREFSTVVYVEIPKRISLLKRF